MTQDKLVSASEVSSHNKETDCWIVVDGQVWDITDFAPEHPGGPEIIYKYAGRDATLPYSSIHSASIIKDGLSADKLVGALDKSTIPQEWSKPLPDEKPSATPSSSSEKPPLDSLINAHDFEIVAQNSATAKTWAFYSSAATALVTRDANAALYNKIWFRPRVMRDVDKITTKTTLLSQPMSFPLIISPSAMAKLIHPDGELAIGRACEQQSVIQCISTNASYSAMDIVSQPSVKSHPFFFQLYVDRVRSKSEALLRKVLARPNIEGIFVTADAAAAGKREADERVKADESLQNPMQTKKAKNDKKGGGYGRLMGSFIDPALCWDDIKWLRSQTKLPLVIKGIMSADDVKIALDHGLDGVMLSNHGGRNLDTSPPAILVLLECHRRFPEIFTSPSRSPLNQAREQKQRMEIIVDGGIKRGTDILKCVCLGATACGIGRSALFATSYGQEGVEHLINILRDEFEVAMRNNGLRRIEEAGPECVNTGRIDHMVSGMRGHPYALDWRTAKL